MTTYNSASDATFDEDSTSGSPTAYGLVYVPKYDGATLTVNAADTDQQTVRLQYEQGGVGSGSWRTLKQWVNVNISNYSFANKNYARVRIVAVADAGGASTASIAEDVVEVDAIRGKDGKTIYTIDSFEKDALDLGVAPKGVYKRANQPSIVETASFTAGPKHVGQIVGLDGSGGALTVTMPSSTGTQDIYEFILTADPGTNDIVFTCDTDAGAFVGWAAVGTDASGPVITGSDNANDLITLNNTTQGGLMAGDRITLQDVATNFWRVTRAEMLSSGSENTVFSGS